MKQIFLSVMIFYLSLFNAFSQVKIYLEDFDIAFYPKKCTDSISFDIKKGEYKNTKLLVNLLECEGKCSIQITDKKGITRLLGSYINSRDTLKKYSNARVMGRNSKKYVYQIRILKYFSPLRNGIWNFYDRLGKLENTIEYIIDD
jgi:hypothetical protein